MHASPPLLRCAESYEYLRDFALHFEGDQSLALRPNFSFSLALARLRREQQQQQRRQQQQQQAAAAEARAAEAARRGTRSNKGASGGSSKGSAAGAEGGHGQGGADEEGESGQEQSALQLMVAAVMLHPSVVPRLQRCVSGRELGVCTGDALRVCGVPCRLCRDWLAVWERCMLWSALACLSAFTPHAPQ